MRMLQMAGIWCVMILLALGMTRGQTYEGTIPQIIKKDGRHALLVDAQPVDSPSPHTQSAMEADAKAFAAVMGYLKVEEGRYENGKFKLMRILNGDETDWGGPRVGAIPAVLHVPLVARNGKN